MLHTIPQIMRPILIHTNTLNKSSIKQYLPSTCGIKLYFLFFFFFLIQSQPVTLTIHSQVANHSFKILSGANSVLKVCLFCLWWWKGYTDSFENLYSLSSTKNLRQYTENSEGN